MKPYFFLALMLMLIIFSSCYTGTSLYRLVNYNIAVKENKVVGKWKKDDRLFIVEELPASHLVHDFQKQNPGKSPFQNLETQDSLLLTRSYILSYEVGVLRYDMLVNLIKLNDDLFADIFPLDVDTIGKIYGSGILVGGGGGDWYPTHSIARVYFKSPTQIELRFIGSDYFMNLLNKGHIAIKHESEPMFNTVLITASTDEMQKFLIKYGKDERLYNKDNVFILQKE